MTEEERRQHQHHSLRERIDAAEAAADEVVAQEAGQLGGEVDALAVPFEEVAAAVRAAIHPESLAGGDRAPSESDQPASDAPASEAGSPPAEPAAGS